MIPPLPAAAVLALLAQDHGPESSYWEVQRFDPPDGAVLEVGGLGFLSDGSLVCSTRRGEVWIIHDALAQNPEEARFHRYATGLWEGLGLQVVQDTIFVLQRGELSRLVDVDRDGLCDEVQTISSDWGLSGNYHEFAYGLPTDSSGNFFASLNVAFPDAKWWIGTSPAPWRGWVLKISPTGRVQPFACGFRSPCGISISPRGELFVTDNQGDWVPACPVFHVTQGGFYGHPASLRWTDEYRRSSTVPSDEVPPEKASSDRKPAAIWLPYKWSRSPGNMAWDSTGGGFGPFAGQFFLAELTNGMVLRGGFQRIRGADDSHEELQGWILPFRHDVGSTLRIAFSPKGSPPFLFCGLTNRGWGGLPPGDGLARIRWTGQEPFEIRDVELLPGGPGVAATFVIRFTQAVDRASYERWIRSVTPGDLATYDYDYWWEYGSPERDTRPLVLAGSTLSSDGTELRLRLVELEPGRVARLRFEGLLDGGNRRLLHPEVSYTINRLPGLPPPRTHVAKVVPPPPARETDEEGWLRLTWGDAIALWRFEGWELVDAELDPDDTTRFRTHPGVSALTNTASSSPSDYVSRLRFGDARFHVEFTLARGARSGIRLLDRYEILLEDGSVCGTLRLPDGTLQPPLCHAYRGPGLRHELDFEFRAPRSGPSGTVREPARFVQARLDGTLIQEDAVLPDPDLRLAPNSIGEGPLILCGTGGPVAYGNLRVRPSLDPEADRGDWEPLFDGETLTGWIPNEDGLWYVEDGILVGEGPRSHLFTQRHDYRNVEIRLRAKISAGGDSGVYLRTSPVEEGWPDGYEAQINSSAADPQKTGSVYARAPITTHLIPPDTWFDYRIRCHDEARGVRIRTFLNGVLVNDWLDPGPAPTGGTIALQQHHEGSVVEFARIDVRRL